jgi:phosphoribosylaminoimidazolecarboxamide formyltransferase/IMP cyclohydrolase
MPDPDRVMRRALLSVSDKIGLVDFARALVRLGFELVSTGGTARTLHDAGLSVIPISDVTGFPEMMDGRVKTLHPLVHGGILARRSRPDDLAAAAAHGIALVDLVVVNLYPFVEAAANPDTSFDALVEEIDIGGPSLVRAAAKNFRDVLVVIDPADYPRVLEQLAGPGGPTLGFRFALARKAFRHTASYDSAIEQALDLWNNDDGGRFSRSTRPLDATAADEFHFSLVKSLDLRYGENPHQTAALFDSTVTVLQGKELSYTNLIDLDAAQRMVSEFAEPAAVVVKHTNPCGAATGSSIDEAYVRARDADSLSAFGGIVALNRPIDERCAAELTSTFIEAVVAPAVDDSARAVLAKKTNMRVVVPVRGASGGASGLPSDQIEMRTIFAGTLMQTPDVVSEAREAWPQGDFPRVVTRREPTAPEWQALRFAWRICAHVKSNAVIFTSQNRTLAIGAGQMSRVDAVRVARMKAESAGPDALRGAAAASDAFFPFRDGLDAVAAAGATAIVQPGGSVRDREVIAAADEHGLAMVFTGRRHFRH